MGLTIFSIPKAFVGHSAVIQRNALDSWVTQPEVDVILLGDDEGVAEAAREVGARHRPDLARTSHGTPRLDEAFATGRSEARFDVLCFVNADMILPQRFAELFDDLPFPRFLSIGARWDCDVRDRIDPADPATWERLSGTAVLGPPFAIDFFVFSRAIEWQMPPFAVGRTVWDNWLIYRAREMKVPVIDITERALVIHQEHDYSHIAASKNEVWKGEEAKRNSALAGLDRLFTIEDATHVLTADGVRPARGLRYRRQRFFNRPLLSPWARPVYRRLLHASRRFRGLSPTI